MARMLVLSLLGALMLTAFACKAKSESETDPVSSPAGALATGGAGSEAASAEPAKTARNALASIAGNDLKAWSRTQAVGSKRVQASKIDKAAAAELLALAEALLKPDKKPTGLRLRWARVIAPTAEDGGGAVAFSTSIVDPVGGERAAELSFAVAIDNGDAFQVFAVETNISRPEADVNQWGFGRDRDVDGDGLADTIVTFHSEQGGGGVDKSLGLILLGSRGGAATIEVHGEDGGWDGGEGEGYHTHHIAEVACWTTLDRRPAFVRVMKTFDSFDDKKPATWESAVWHVDDDGSLVRSTHRLVATDDKGTDAWKAIVGADAKPVFSKENVRDPPDCPGNGQAVLVRGVVHRLN